MNSAPPTPTDTATITLKPRGRKPRLETELHGADSTRSLFLDAAERLFGERGYEGATIRAIADGAGANLGALHYYWGSKGALFKALCERRFQPVVEKRLALLDECVAKAAGGPLDLKSVLAAYIYPALHHDDDNLAQQAVFRKLLARIMTDPSPEIRQIMAETFDEVSFRLIRMLRQCCPHLDDASFYWRLHGVFGMVQHVNTGAERMVYLSRGKFDGGAIERGIEEIANFLVAGLSQPNTVSNGAGTLK